MEITNEIKAKIFGLYLPCEVKCGKQSGWIHSGKTYPADLHFYLNNSYKIQALVLTPLSEITDEDAIEAYDIEHPKNEASDLDKVESLKMWIETDAIGRDVADFLRSRGYALPYMGIDLFDAGIAIPKTKKL